MVNWEVPFDILDNGAPRSTADILELAFSPQYPGATATAAKSVLRRDGMANYQLKDNKMIELFVMVNPDLIKTVDRLESLRRDPVCDMPATAARALESLEFASHVLEIASPNELRDYSDMILVGGWGGAEDLDDASLVVRRQIIKNLQAPAHRRYSMDDLIGMMARGLRLRLAGDSPKTIKPNRDSTWADLFGIKRGVRETLEESQS
jgi:hypothetical protein